MSQLIPRERIESCIYLIRNQKVMLDSDLAALYGVETKALNRAIKRNQERFPEDFMFQLTKEEVDLLRCHFGTLKDDPGTAPEKRGRGQHRKYLPYAFTEPGVAMLSSVLRSRRAALVNVAIMRSFVRLRQMLASNRELAKKLEELEWKFDTQFKIVFDLIHELMQPPTPARPKIGFQG